MLHLNWLATWTNIATGLDSNGFVNDSLAKKPELKAAEAEPVKAGPVSKDEPKSEAQKDVVSYIDNDGEKVELDIEIPSFLRRKKM